MPLYIPAKFSMMDKVRQYWTMHREGGRRMAEEQPKVTNDPLDLAMELLLETFATLGESSIDPEKRAATLNVIQLVQAMAQLEIARSLRDVRIELTEIVREIRGPRG